MGVGSYFLLPSGFSESSLASGFLHLPFLLCCLSFALIMASDSRKDKKRVDGPAELPQDSRLGNPINDFLLNLNVEVFSLSESDVVRLRRQYRILEHSGFQCLVRVVE